MKVKNIVEEDFVNYKKPSMFMITPKCDFKCCKEAGCEICQNMDVVNYPSVEIDNDELVKKYINNPITKSIVIGGLEPFETFEDMYDFINKLRCDYNCNDDVVIYTGFYPNEIEDKVNLIKKFKNIIIKFGRFVPGQEPHYDEVLGVKLASDNQWAEEIC